MRRLAFLLVAAAACGHPSKRSSGPHDDPPPDATVAIPKPPPTLAQREKQLADLLAENWDYTLETHPELASMVGDHRHDDRWTDRSPDAIAAELAAKKSFLDRFTAIDTAGFSEQELLNQRLMVRALQETLDLAKFEDWLMPLNQFTGPHLDVAQMVARLRFSTVDDYDHYVARLTKVPAVFDQAIVLMRAGMAKGLMPPKEQLELTIPQATKLGAGKVAESPFAQPVAKFPDSIPAADQDRLRAAVLDAVEHQVFPAYQKLATFLEDEYAPNGRADPGLWALPDGDARYAAAVKQLTTTDMTADEIHELGLAEVARIETEQAAIGKKLGFKSLAAFRKGLRKNKKLYAKSRKDLLDRCQKAIDQMYAKLPELFGRLPEQKLVVLSTEAFYEKDASFGQYFPGSPDGSRPGMVRINTSSPTKRMWTDLEATAYHEGVPGHHLQITIQHELPGIAPFRQFGFYIGFMEGWGLYSEQLGKDVGFYTDPYADYGRLQLEMWRAIRLVVDTGLHAKKWTRAQVVDYFHAHSTLDEMTVQAETNRYIVWPGQALAYKVGELTILRLREEAKQALGDKFDIRAFHDLVLGSGAMPLDVLETRVHDWLAAQR